MALRANASDVLERHVDDPPIARGHRIERDDLAFLGHPPSELPRHLGELIPPEERRAPAIINGERRTRIARGSGTTVQDVNRLLKQYAQLRRMMKDIKGMSGRLGKKDLRRALPFLRG